MASKQTYRPSTIHPKLRMTANGSDKVNFRRAELVGYLASSLSPGDVKLDPAVAARMTRSDGPREPGNEEAMRRQGRAKKRAKLSSKNDAQHAFVDVFIELAASGPRDQAPNSDATALTRDIEAAMASHRGAVEAAEPTVAGDMVCATVPVTYLKELARNRRVAFVQPAESLTTRLPRPQREKGARPTKRAVEIEAGHDQGEGVIIGIIDVGGFDFAHPDFLDPRGRTRFKRIWDQGGKFRKTPRGLSRGTEFTDVHLNEALDKAAKTAKGAGAGIPATEIEPQSQREPGSHGTHVASIAAGNSGVCPKAEIVGVLIDIPAAKTDIEERRRTFSDARAIVEAVQYLLKYAKKRKKPISINISLGTNGGAHDASGGVSRWLDALLATEGRCICVAAGNAGQESAESEDDIGFVMGRIHASGRLPARGLDLDLEWTVVGDTVVDVSENELEIWYSPQDRITVQVKPPGATEWITVEPQQFIENRKLPSGTFLSVYNELYHPVNGANTISIYLSPDLGETPVGVASGIWTIRLRGDEIRDGRFHCWIERDDPFEFDRVGHRRISRFPSFFSERSNVDSHSINSLACGHRVIAVANMDDTAQKISITSSQGPTRDNREKPDIAAPGTRIVAANGFAGEGELWTTMSGTSMASPYVAGVVGLMLSAKNTLTAAQCAGIVQRTSRPLPGADYAWRNDAGYGRIDAVNALEQARGATRRVDITSSRTGKVISK